MELGKSFEPPISGERIRQILNPKSVAYCNLHKCQYHDFCKYCAVTKIYKDYLDGIKTSDLKNEIGRLSRTSRLKTNVIQRKLLVKHLRDIESKSFIDIGKSLKRRHTSIMNLYYSTQ